MSDYWSERLEHALERSRNAPTAQVRHLHLQLAAHYESLQALCSKHPGNPPTEAVALNATNDPGSRQ